MLMLCSCPCGAYVPFEVPKLSYEEIDARYAH